MYAIFVRKVKVATIVTVLTALTFGILLGIIDRESFSEGSAFGYSSTIMIVLYYVGAFVYGYGGVVTTVLEIIDKKVKPLGTPIFIILHGLFGSAIMFYFSPTIYLISIGTLAASAFGAIDRWMVKSELKPLTYGSILFIILIHIPLTGPTHETSEIPSPPPPPLTAELAYERALEHNKGSISFPEEGEIYTETNEYGHTVTRTTSVTKVGKENFLVTFREVWENKAASGYFLWILSVTPETVEVVDESGNSINK